MCRYRDTALPAKHATIFAAPLLLTAVLLLFRPHLIISAPYTWYLVIVTAAAVYAGPVPAALAAIESVFCVDYYFDTSLHSLDIRGDAVMFSYFLAAAFAAITLVHVAKRRHATRSTPVAVGEPPDADTGPVYVDDAVHDTFTSLYGPAVPWAAVFDHPDGDRLTIWAPQLPAEVAAQQLADAAYGVHQTHARATR